MKIEYNFGTLPIKILCYAKYFKQRKVNAGIAHQKIGSLC